MINDKPKEGVCSQRPSVPHVLSSEKGALIWSLCSSSSASSHTCSLEMEMPYLPGCQDFLGNQHVDEAWKFNLAAS